MNSDDAVGNDPGGSTRTNLTEGLGRAGNTAGRASIGSVSYLALLACLLSAIALVAFYVRVVRPYVEFPADLLMWSESNFVGDIIKLRIGAPLYGDPADGNALIYTPGAPLLTYAIARPLGLTQSISGMRWIQLSLTALAAVVATLCTRDLFRIAFPRRDPPFPKTWLLLSLFTLCLAAVSPQVNRYAHALHADALALLVSMVTFWFVLRHMRKPTVVSVLVLALCPAVGFFTKQLLVAWGPILFVFLFFSAPRRAGHWLLYGLVAPAALAAVVYGCYLVWGEAFWFYIFEIMGGSRKTISFGYGDLNISLMRSADHVIRAWMELTIGLVGGWLVLRKSNVPGIGALALSWLVLLAVEAFSSGAGWATMYHFGPGVMIGVVWALVAIACYWPVGPARDEGSSTLAARHGRIPVAALAIVTLFVALRAVPSKDERSARFWPNRDLPGSAYRYVREIEQQFAGVLPDAILLDIGNWIYLRHDYLARHRAVSLGDQPCNDLYANFDGLLANIRQQNYAKILVHDLHEPEFAYDHRAWPRPSGVRKALLTYYTEIDTIEEVEGVVESSLHVYCSGSISVLIPRSETTAPE